MNQRQATRKTRNHVRQSVIGTLLVLAAVLAQACGGSEPAPAQAIATLPPVASATIQPAPATETVGAVAAQPPVATPAPTAAGLELDHHGNPIVPEIYEKLEQDDVVIEFNAEGFLGLGGRGTILSSGVKEGEYATVKFHIRDDQGVSLSGLRPAAWMDPSEPERDHGDAACRTRVQGYLEGYLNVRPQVDFNSFFILAMNQDATVSVIDPLANVAGMTQLYAMLLLKQPGEDWTLSNDGQLIFVSMPAANQVAVINTNSFQVDRDIDAGRTPTRIAFQPDGRLLWVGNDATDGTQGGVTVIDPAALSPVQHIATGTGHHDLAFSPDSRFAYVTNAGDGTLSVIDTATLTEVAEVEVDGTPIAVDVSSQSGAIYVADGAGGTITVIDGASLTPSGIIETGPGLVTLRFSPGGRWAFAINGEDGTIYVVDAGTNAVVFKVPSGGTPAQVTFTADLAYVQMLDAPRVLTISLAELAPGKQLPVTSVPIGNYAPGAFGPPASAAAIAPAPDNAGVMIANPADKQIHYYVEGATGPLGSFEGHGRSPRAALVVDRSLREESPGLYVGRVRLPQSGEYEVAFLLDDPQITHCFHFTVAANPQLEASQQNQPPKLTLLSDLAAVQAGDNVTFEFSLADAESGEPLPDLADVTVTLSPVTGGWQNRVAAAPTGDGRYAAELEFAAPGIYNLYFAVPSIGAGVNEMPRHVVQVKEGG